MLRCNELLLRKVPGLALAWDKLFHTPLEVPCKCDMRRPHFPLPQRPFNFSIFFKFTSLGRPSLPKHGG
eukprot:COSAG06_NODE_33111_length_495_cov_0.777778_1_plen_68_part_01